MKETRAWDTDVKALQFFFKATLPAVQGKDQLKALMDSLQKAEGPTQCCQTTTAASWDHRLRWPPGKVST